MSDLRIDDVVSTQRMMGVDGEWVRTTCLTCSKQHKAERSEFERDNLVGGTYIPNDVDMELLEWVAVMRAWNCCHEGQEPLDTLPSDPR